MIGGVRKSELVKNLPKCKDNCPRVYPVLTADNILNAAKDGDADWEKDAESKAKRKPQQYASQLGEHMELIKDHPCFLLFRMKVVDSRTLRNYVIRNCSCLEVIRGRYCGIAPQVYDVQRQIEADNLAIGLLKFKDTDSAYRFSFNNSSMKSEKFLNEDWDLWNVSLCAEDESIAPSKTYADKFVNKNNVFHLLHIRKETDAPDEARGAKAELSSESEEVAHKRQLVHKALQSVSSHSGKIIANTSACRRINGRPSRVEDSEALERMPQKWLYLTQWPGEGKFWSWYESEAGRQFHDSLQAYSSNYQSLLFTACLDFKDNK